MYSIRSNSGSSNNLLSAEIMQPLFSSKQLSYKVGSSTLRVQTKFVMAVLLIGTGTMLLIFVLFPSSRTTDSHYRHFGVHGNSVQHFISPNHIPVEKFITQTEFLEMGSRLELQHPCKKPYNNTYPLSPVIKNVKRGIARYRIAVVADMDTNSKDATTLHTWHSNLRKGYLEVYQDLSHVQVWWDADIVNLTSHLSYGGRGLELSELVVFNGKLYSVDDRTGVVYAVEPDTGKLVPWVVLTDGDGNSEKGFKSEWATVRDGLLYVGGLGKEWTTNTGELVNHNPQWIKTIDVDGRVTNHDWTLMYEKVREIENIRFPGYMIHEAVCWSPHRSEWLFLPRRASTEQYDEKEDEHRGTDLLITASADFKSVSVSHVGDIIPTHGFSSAKFVPDTRDEIIVALKSEEVEGVTGTYIMAFTRKGKVLLKETKIGDYKYEGIEFI